MDTKFSIHVSPKIGYQTTSRIKHNMTGVIKKVVSVYI